MRIRRFVVLAATGLLAAGTAIAGPAGANHSWGNYHWARTANPFTLSVGDNVGGAWDPYLDGAIADWTSSSVLNLARSGGAASSKNCRPPAGRVEVCNASYGNNGWLGIAQIWASGSHITQGSVRVNDFYFSQARYNTPAWRAMVMCQEVGHTLGLGHQDESTTNTNLGTCMDYTSSPSSNQHPNQHDYNMLEQIYTHLDTTTTLAATATGAGGAGAAFGGSVSEWGQAIRYDAAGRPSLFVRDLGNDQRVFTFVTWA